jgi:predicted kinase
MPKFYMMIGVPGSGKSTWIRNNNSEGMIVVSSDTYIENQAVSLNKTYSEIFNKHIKAANTHTHNVAKQAFELNLDVIWDQTNVTRKIRAGKLAMVPNHYEKIAVVFATPEHQELQKRLADRPGKIIPQNIVMAMISSLEQPSLDECFDKIITVA